MPVGQGYQSVTCRLSSDAVLLGHHIVLYEGKHLVTITLGDENLLVHVVVVGLRVAVFPAPLLSATKGVKQTVIDYQARSHYQEFLCEPSALHRLVPGIEHLPNQEGVHHPSLARSRSHLHGILRKLVFLFGELRQICPVHQFGDYLLVSIQYGGLSQHLVQIDDVEDGLSLSLMEIPLTLCAKAFAKPIVQERCRGGCHLLQHLPTLPCRIHHVGQSACQLQGYIVRIYCHSHNPF